VPCGSRRTGRASSGAPPGATPPGAWATGRDPNASIRGAPGAAPPDRPDARWPRSRRTHFPPGTPRPSDGRRARGQHPAPPTASPPRPPRSSATLRLNTCLAEGSDNQVARLEQVHLPGELRELLVLRRGDPRHLQQELLFDEEGV